MAIKLCRKLQKGSGKAGVFGGFFGINYENVSVIEVEKMQFLNKID
ncbi:MAG: hypothetical protein ACPH5K_00650 [Polaribacter sp.]